ncbi:hypothetical protein DFH11DRAFT_1281319 [Phellopilus nigrolimitatus]|nr:hypothetical protein DFH11DRAFT_1281319 [Phellopilus nigrolimitatus]
MSLLNIAARRATPMLVRAGRHQLRSAHSSHFDAFGVDSVRPRFSFRALSLFTFTPRTTSYRWPPTTPPYVAHYAPPSLPSGIKCMLSLDLERPSLHTIFPLVHAGTKLGQGRNPFKPRRSSSASCAALWGATLGLLFRQSIYFIILAHRGRFGTGRYTSFMYCDILVYYLKVARLSWTEQRNRML